MGPEHENELPFPGINEEKDDSRDVHSNAFLNDLLSFEPKIMSTFLATARENKFWMEHLELELEAHIWWFCSTHIKCSIQHMCIPDPCSSKSVH